MPDGQFAMEDVKPPIVSLAAQDQSTIPTTVMLLTHGILGDAAQQGYGKKKGLLWTCS